MAGSPRAISRALAAVLMAFAVSVPTAAYACPMCFTGGNSNSDAFLWGSLLLMLAPVGAIGGLLYWAYRRARANDAPAEVPAGAAHDSHDSRFDAPHAPAIRALRGSNEH